MSENQRIKDAAWAIVADPRSSRVEKLEALKIVCAARGILLPALDENFLSVRQVCQLRQARQDIVEKVLRRKVRRKKENRRAFLRRQIKAAQQAQGANEKVT